MGTQSPPHPLPLSGWSSLHFRVLTPSDGQRETSLTQASEEQGGMGGSGGATKVLFEDVL